MRLYITIVGCLPHNKQSSSFCGTSGPYKSCALVRWPLCPTAKETLSEMGKTGGTDADCGAVGGA